MLHRNGIAAEVSSVEVILRKDLPISTVCRLEIAYKHNGDENWPRSLFLKLPRGLNDDTKVSGSDDHAEVEFYRSVASQIGCPPLVRCYDAAYSEETNSSHILLDDLTETHSQPEQQHAPSEEMSQLAVEALAKAHARCWRSVSTTPPLKRHHSYPGGEPRLLPSLSNHPGGEDAATPPQTRRGVGSGFSRGVVPEKWKSFDVANFVENLNRTVTDFLKAADLPSVQQREYRRMLDAATEIWGRITRPDHVTVTHGDMHWWNFLYPREARTHAVHVIDWHLWHIDLGARDLAFLLALGGFAEPRPSIEEKLLRVYHEALGVSDYTWEMLVEDYRWSSIRNLNIPVIYWKQGKHYSTWQTALRRAFEAYERLECGALV